MIQKRLMSCLMLSAAAVAGAAVADTSSRLVPAYGTIEPLYGTIEPLYGTIEPLYGTIEPLYGTIEPLYGTIEPLYGTIEPLYGTIEPLYGTIEPLKGLINPFYGTIEPLKGVINPFYGKVGPLWGDTTQFWGSVNPFYGTIEPLYGTIEPLYGTIEPLYGTIEPLYGTIEPLAGSIDAFWGTIRPNYGTIEPLYGTIEPLYGTIEPLYGTIEPLYGTIEPLWKNVGPFWKTAGSEWGDINLAWSKLQTLNATDYTALQAQLKTLIAQSDTFWGKAVEYKTKESFEAYIAPILAKYGINLDDASSLASVSPQARYAFFLNYYDALMGFTGMPRPDWWMGSVHWTPLLEQIASQGSSTTVGVLDSTFSGSANNIKNVKFVGGYNYYVNDHGAMVASLIAAQHTAGSVMGVAPTSTILNYNPFDHTGTASWEDVSAGIQALYARGASVINVSMGVPGQVLSEEWANILNNPQLYTRGSTAVIVKAAGNEGVTQSTNINWTGSQAPDNLIIVGSVGPTGVISSFSNRPGNACILINSSCQEQNKLMYHFLVAPGENILVSDNAGGVTRASGTSFAAPLVTGAVALLQDRWPWLKKYPGETVDILFKSATDLGAPGVDPIYGWGELNVEASQSPLSFNDLQVFVSGSSAKGQYNQAMSATTLKSALLDPGQLALWQKKSAYITAFENIGATYRDFEIPLSAMLTSKSSAYGRGDRPFQTYLYQRLINWANSPAAFGFNTSASHVAKGDWSLSLSTTQATPDEMRHDTSPVHYEFAATNTKTGLGLRFGEGAGAHALTGMDGFGLRSDFDPATGGVNPVLGFASGGAYANAEFKFGKAHFTAGFTQKSDDHMAIDPTYGPVLEENLAPSHSFASVMGVDYEIKKGFKLNASFTSLRESAGLLGSQGGGLFEMANGTHTTATTVGASYQLGGNWTLIASATMAKSAAPQFTSDVLSFTSPNMTSTAYEVVATKTGLFDEHDSVRFSLAQPLHIEAAALQFQSVQVVDRNTGELGSFSQQWNVSGNREYRFETVYGLPVFEGTGQFDGYALIDVNPHASLSGAPELAIGGRLRFSL